VPIRTGAALKPSIRPVSPDSRRPKTVGYFTLEITSLTRESWADANSELSAIVRSDRTRLLEATSQTMMIPSAKANEAVNTKADVL
jgi:hypothetical protein